MLHSERLEQRQGHRVLAVVGAFRLLLRGSTHVQHPFAKYEIYLTFSKSAYVLKIYIKKEAKVFMLSLLFLYKNPPSRRLLTITCSLSRWVMLSSLCATNVLINKGGLHSRFKEVKSLKKRVRVTKADGCREG